jgi:tetratricopeptide (TPR) repeat protein
MVRYYAWVLANMIVLLSATVPTLILPERAIALPGNPVAQPQTSEIDRSIDEGMRLVREGSKVSLMAAIAKFETVLQLLQLSRTEADLAKRALILLHLGRVYSSLGENSKALELYNQALPIFHTMGDWGREEAATLNDIGGVYFQLGKKTKALELYNRALSLHRAVGNRGGEATTLNNIGLVYSDLGEKSKALELYNQALPLYHALRNQNGEAATLTNSTRSRWVACDKGN